jgi:amidohydrolase
MPSVMMFVGSETDDTLHSPTSLPTDTDLARVARSMLAGYLGGADLHRRSSGG